MAHLTLQLGGSVVVPFEAPQGMVRARRRAVTRRVRWKGLREAAAIAETIDAVFCAVRPPQAQALHPIFRKLGSASREDASK